jgi:DNA-directed RNA polymerase subunit beta'
MLKGKQGRFRQNLLGKRVDYSGRSVIVVGPQLKLHQCGLPKTMALELFKPFVMKRLVELNHAQNIKSAKRMVERTRPVVWDVLEEVITEHPVLLNRAPTLHRLGIQAFEPLLVEGKAIHLHPLVCAAFNADFDGDQMAVHLPLSAEAQAEARILMLSSNNILKPSDGRPVTMPSQDMIIGLHHLTSDRPGAVGESRVFGSQSEAIMAFDRGVLDLNAAIKIRMSDVVFAAGEEPEGYVAGEPLLFETTLGRTIFNEALPVDYPYVNEMVGKGKLGEIVNTLAETYPKVAVAAALDALKDAGYKWATRSGVTIAISDVAMPDVKNTILDEHEQRAIKVQSQFDLGLITDDERRGELIEIWTQATDKVASVMRENLENNERNTLYRMVSSGARGNWMQVRQIAGMRGLVANPKGEIIPRPIKSNYREGLSVLEYFIASHGARKGLADTALRTADSGYLTRRLVDVSQDVIIREEDCGTSRGLNLPIAERLGDTLVPHPRVETSIYARTIASDVVDADGNVIVEGGSDAGDVVIDALIAAGVEQVKVRSVLTCESRVGTCAKCYGRSLATGKLVDIGEAVGIIAAQSIGEPGTQLTMRTFHTGGVASAEDITQGLPRVTELFEARTPKGEAPIAEYTGKVTIEDAERSRLITLTPDDGSEEIAYQVSKRARLLIADGDHVQVGTQLVQGAVDPKKVLRILGPRAAQKHLVDEVQETYRSQGVDIHDKHIEVIVRQMLRRITVLDSGDSTLLPGELAERTRFEDANRAAIAAGGQPAAGRPELMGITKASLATDSWLSAASFQETTRVLTEAAMSGRRDPLLGLKENVIIGKLIPAGTGLARYRDIEVEPTEQAKAELYPSFGYDEIDFPTLGMGSGEAIPLEDFDFGDFR